MKNLGTEFREFILQGNVVGLAVAVVVGTAFGAVVTALVENLITPLIAAIGGQPDFSDLTFTINESRFLYGDFINKIITFLIVATVIFTLVIKPMNLLFEPAGNEVESPGPTTVECPYCLSRVPNAATRCAFCTSDLTATTA